MTAISDTQHPLPETAKALGAFYTDAQIADFLVWWAIRDKRETVMDPSFGCGVFLRSACGRLRRLGGNAARQVFGVEIDGPVYARITEKLSDEFNVQRGNLLHSDFFAVDPSPARQVDVLVGNPPFIRYQRFSGANRDQALQRASDQGVNLSKLCSSWAPFLLHSSAFVKPGGRLAMVLPMEVAHAGYALPVLRHLAAVFGRVTFLTFRKKLFPDLSEDNLLLLAEDKGAGPAEFLLRDLTHAGALTELEVRDRLPLAGTRRIDPEALGEGRERLLEHLLPRPVRELYRELREHEATCRLGAVADVGIGYVTGANDFFHLTPGDACLWGIPDDFLRPAVLRGRALAGLRMTSQDWARQEGQGSYLLRIPQKAALPDAVARYVESGERAGVHLAYKCRCRSPWFAVPHVYEPDAFLSYMGGAVQRLVVNEAGAVAPNSLHVVRLHKSVRATPYTLAALWQSSLTRLSCEIEGHSLGGGMLKLEPTEAESVALAWPADLVEGADLAALAQECDCLVRRGAQDEAEGLADRMILQRGLGLSDRDCELLRQGADALRARRYARGART